MKKMISLALALVCANVLYAQNTLVATLSHGDDITMYYGNAAFQNAHNAAVSGDIINLSGGTFNGTTVTKAVTIRGTGIDVANPTIIISSTINIAADETNRLMMEGVRIGTLTLYDTNNYPTFQKCQFTKVSVAGKSTSVKGTVRNAMYINCKITESYAINNNTAKNHRAQFINCYINKPQGASLESKYLNCVIVPYISGSTSLGNSLLVNCIFYYDGGQSSYKMADTAMANNCVAINLPSLFDNSQSNSDCTTSTFAEVFKDFTGTYTDAQTFELTDEAKAQFLGTDGTEVGMHGGVFPYTSTPSYPQITKMNVANKTTADGKLSVDIEVSAAQ